MKVKFTRIFKLLIVGMTALTVASANFEPTVVSAANHVKSHRIIKKHKTVKKKKKIVEVATNTGAGVETQTKPVNSIPDLAKDTPEIADFNQEVLTKYSLLGYIWQKPHSITYAYQNMSDHQAALIDTEVKAINDLGIVHLVKGNYANSDININLTNNLHDKYHMQDKLDYYGMTAPYFFPDSNFKGLQYFGRADIDLGNDSINKHADNDYDTLFKSVILHELGHALGLDHLPDNIKEQNIMTDGINGSEYVRKNTNGEVAIDQYFINSLAILYHNY